MFKKKSIINIVVFQMLPTFLSFKYFNMVNDVNAVVYIHARCMLHDDKVFVCDIKNPIIMCFVLLYFQSIKKN